MTDAMRRASHAVQSHNDMDSLAQQLEGESLFRSAMARVASGETSLEAALRVLGPQGEI